MRNLQTKDIFKLAGIIRKLNLKKEVMDLKAESEAPELFGAKILLILFENIDKAEKEIASFFADIGEMSTDEFLAMDLEQLGKFIEELKGQPGLDSFFQSAFKAAK